MGAFMFYAIGAAVLFTAAGILENTINFLFGGWFI